jgi:hypothetical protein
MRGGGVGWVGGGVRVATSVIIRGCQVGSRGMHGQEAAVILGVPSVL